MSAPRERLRAGVPLSGFVQTFASPVATQALAAAGADWLMFDREHGLVGVESLHTMIAATAGSGCSPWVRVAGVDAAGVKTALDAGAEGIVFPMIRNAAEAADCAALLRYPPVGRRGFGPYAAHSRWGVELDDYAARCDGQPLCVLLIETRAAVDDIRAICAVPGVDALIIAPYDLSMDLGLGGRIDEPGLQAAIVRAQRAALAAGIPLGGAATTPQRTRELLALGYRLLVHDVDVLMLKQRVREALSWRQPASSPD